MAGHHMGRLEGGHLFEHVDPASDIGLRAVAEQAFDIDDIAREHDIAIGKPHEAVARRVGRAAVHDLEGQVADGQVVIGFEGDVGVAWRGVLERFAEEIRKPAHLHGAASLLIGDGRLRGDDRGAFCLPVAIAQPAVILPAGIDDMGDGAVGQRGDDLVDHSRAVPRTAGIHENDARVGLDHTEGRVVRKIAGVALDHRPDQSPDILRDLLHLERLGAGDLRGDEGGDGEKEARFQRLFLVWRDGRSANTCEHWNTL